MKVVFKNGLWSLCELLCVIDMKWYLSYKTLNWTFKVSWHYEYNCENLQISKSQNSVNCSKIIEIGLDFIRYFVLLMLMTRENFSSVQEHFQKFWIFGLNHNFKIIKYLSKIKKKFNQSTIKGREISTTRKVVSRKNKQYCKINTFLAALRTNKINGTTYAARKGWLHSQIHKHIIKTDRGWLTCEHHCSLYN